MWISGGLTNVANKIKPVFTLGGQKVTNYEHFKHMVKFNQKFSHRSDLLYNNKRDTNSEETRGYILSGSRVFAFEEYI
jgi:hypothetical protein